MKLVKEVKHHYVLSALLAYFVVFRVNVPHLLAGVVDTLLGRVVVITAALSLLFVHPVLGSVAILAAYELIRRSENTTGSGPLRRFLPSETKKGKEFSAMNQFPTTVEEEVIHKMIPRVSGHTLPKASYKPVQDKLHQAAQLQN